MKLYIIGICGTFMAGIARIAKQLGHEVIGNDQNVYPPMSTQLEALGIEIEQGYEVTDAFLQADLVIVGNVAKRGMPAVEYLLEKKPPFISAPAWLYQEVLRHKTVLAVCGTHGKSTTSAMTAWILEKAGLNPSFLIGGAIKGFEYSARITESDYFVIEADEYDSAFFDKRSKLIHYFPTHCLINNLEFDHADIFEDLAAIEKQFHHLLKVLPSKGLLVVPEKEPAIERVMAKGCWSRRHTLGKDSTLCPLSDDFSSFHVCRNDEEARVDWSLIGEHNAQNAMGAMSLAYECGVSLENSAKALGEFQGVKRRLELVGQEAGIHFYDDFAHHPTAVSKTIAAVRAKIGQEPLCVFFELGSNSMKKGVHLEPLLERLQESDMAFLYSATGDENLRTLIENSHNPQPLLTSVQEIINKILAKRAEMKHVIFMSNKNLFGLLKDPLTEKGLLSG